MLCLNISIIISIIFLIYFFYYRKTTKVKFRTFRSLARVPAKSTPSSACYDIYSTRDVLLGPGAADTVELDLGFKFAKKCICRIYSRSGLSLRPLFLDGGVIDSDCRGTSSVVLTNVSSWKFEIKKEVELRK